MKTALRVILTSWVLPLSSVSAPAQSLEDIKARFAAADADHDGKLTIAEAKKGLPRIAANFAKIDSAKKGYLTLDEVLAVAKRR
ncbi:hypothetical protein [Sphingomonas zeae]|jgi:Ca2+-binding EF-hand superfamily protein